MGLLSRLGLARSSEVAALREEVAHLQVRAKFAKPVSSGVEITWGSFEYEKQELLRGNKKWDTLAKMELDPHVKGGLNAAILPLMGAQWSITAASDKPLDVEIKEFVEANLLRVQNDRFGPEYWCQSSWRAQRLPEILTMLSNGFAMFAKSTREVDGKIVYDRLQWLEPSSVDPHGWVLDDQDNLIAVKRTYLSPQVHVALQEPLEARRIALYSWDYYGARFEGRPFIRSAFGAWYRKDFMLRQAVIWAQKVGAPIPVGIYPSGYTPEDRARVEELVQSMRGQSPEWAYGVFPATTDGRKPELGYVGSSEGEVDRMRGLIDGENSEVAHAVGQKTGMLGETETGSRAVAATISKAEMQQIQAIAEVVCEWEADGVGNLRGLIKEVTGWNYPNVKAHPRLTVSKISPYEGVQHVDSLVKASQAGLVPNCPELRRATTAMFGIALPETEYEKEPPKPVVASPFGTNGEREGEQYDTEDEETVAASLAAARDRFAALLLPSEGAPKGAGFRRPTVLEARYCALVEVAETFRVGERDIHNVMRDVRDAMIRDLMNRLRAGKVTRRNLESQRRSAFRGKARAEAAVLSPIERTGVQGMGHVEGELKRMRGQRASVA